MRQNPPVTLRQMPGAWQNRQAKQFIRKLAMELPPLLLLRECAISVASYRIATTRWMASRLLEHVHPGQG